MKKWQKAVLIGLTCYASYYLSYRILLLTSLTNKLIQEISVVFFLLPIIVYFLIIKTIIRKQDDEVSKISLKIKKINELNNMYNFKKILRKKYHIVEREYSRKSLERVTGDGIIKYYIENNINSFRTDIESALYNLSLLDEYTKEAMKIADIESDNLTKYPINKFKKIENRVFNRLVHKKDEFLIRVSIEVYYKSNGGKVYDNRTGRRSFDEIVSLYNEWVNGNKFEETKRQERMIMNDDIRYNVFQRDNYTCQICGATAKDGAKLHVDHIIPVSKGGKTVMSNLQILCDRCNIGKGDKIPGDATDDDMICPQCGGRLVNRKGKYGAFIGCSNYPRCSYKRKI